MRRMAAVLSLVLASPALAVECPPAWGLPPDPPTWCERTSAGPDGIPGSGDENPACTVNTADGAHAPCNQGQATHWMFREGDDYCQNCPYVFYVVVDCSTSFHVPNHDVEAMLVSVRDMTDGSPVLLTVQNECSRRDELGDPFLYCDACDMAGAIIPKDDGAAGPMNVPPGSCVSNGPLGPRVLAEMPCHPLRRTGFDVGWGVPVDADADGDLDEDGDGSVDVMTEPPCATCGWPACSCGDDTNSNRVTEMQVIDVKLHGSPLLSGVYRVELLSGGLEWQLFSNCDGSGDPQFPIFDTCAAAFAAWNPLPELALHDADELAFALLDDSGCPDSIRVRVTTCNRSRGVASATAPFTIAFDDPGTPAFLGDSTAHPTDPACQGPLQPGECRTCEWTVPVSGAVTLATLTVDAADAVAECSESVTNARCGMDARRTASMGVCGFVNSDEDGDGLANWLERNLGFNSVASDADGDGLADLAEWQRGTDPRAADTDGDGVGDAIDLCPVTSDALQGDGDGDGTGDACEPGARDVLALLSRLPDGRLKLEWHHLEGVESHDLAVGDLDALHRTRAHTHDVVECSMPPGFTGRIVQDPLGPGRSAYFVVGSVFPGPDEWGATSRGDAIPPPGGAPCR